MGDFPAVHQLVVEVVSPVLRLRGGGVEAEAASPTPAPPLYPLPPGVSNLNRGTSVSGSQAASMPGDEDFLGFRNEFLIAR